MPIPIVNDNDEIIGYKERSEIGKELIRSVALRVINEYGETLLVQRVATKKREPNKWTIAVGGGVEAGETYEEAIVRETEEEIGIIVKPTFLVKKKSVDEEVINFFQAIFTIQLPKDTPFKFDEHEIQATKRLSKAEIDERLKTTPEDFIGSFRRYRKIINESITALPLVKDNQKGKTYQADDFQILYRNAGSTSGDNEINEAETLYFITGIAEITIKEQNFIVEAPAKVMVPAKTYHKIEAKTDISFILYTN